MFTQPTQTIFYLIAHSIKVYRQFAQKTIQATIPDLTLDQALLLISLAEYPELPLSSQSEILFKESSSVTRMVEALEKKGYISRTIHKEDKRKFMLTVTAKGQNTLSALIEIIQSNRKIALNEISEKEMDQLNTLLNKIINNCNTHSL